MIAAIMEGAGKAWEIFGKHRGAYLACFALLACAIGVGLLLVDRANLRADLIVARAELDKVKAAQVVARTAQAVVNHQPAMVSANLAGISNAEAYDYYERGRADGAAYAAAHRVPASCPAGQPGHANLPGTDHTSPLDDRSGNAADMVAISRANFDRCTDIGLRLAKVHQDAEALINAGIAVTMTDDPSAPSLDRR